MGFPTRAQDHGSIARRQRNYRWTNHPRLSWNSNWSAFKPLSIPGSHLILFHLGVFVDNAMDLIPTPPWTHGQMEEYFSATANLALQYGLTSIHDAATTLPMVDFFRKSVLFDLKFRVI